MKSKYNRFAGETNIVETYIINLAKLIGGCLQWEYVASIFVLMQQVEEQRKRFSASALIKRFGVAGFLFFLIKGILWLIVPTALIWLGYSW